MSASSPSATSPARSPPTSALLLVARVLISLIHGAYFGTAMVLASTLVDEKRRGFAVALILSGLTVANILGVPIGTAIGTRLRLAHDLLGGGACSAPSR